MSLQTEINNVKDETKPNGIRYMSLCHCIGLHPFLGGFVKTWNFLDNKFGLKQGEVNSNSILIKCAEFIEKDHHAWRELQKSHEIFIKKRVKLGLPKPKCYCEFSE